MTEFLKNRTVVARYAIICAKAVAGFPLTIATEPDDCGDYSAGIATEDSATSMIRKSCCFRQLTI